MKHIITTAVALLFTTVCFAQDVPKPADPCMKADTNQIKQLLIGTWTDVKDTTHHIIITPDSLTEIIVAKMGTVIKYNTSYWSYKFTDNFASTDAVTCYTMREVKDGYTGHVDVPINYVDAHYLLTGTTGKTVYKKK